MLRNGVTTSAQREDFCAGKNIYIQALEAEQAGDWATAHELVEHMVTAEAALVLGYLHRVAGDPGLAEYWYNRAAQPVCVTSLAKEWEVLYAALKTIGEA